MPILALGVSHRRATVELLERLAFAEEDLVKAYARAGDDPAIEEAVILSTCNRVEVYGRVPTYHAGFTALKRLLCEARDVDPDEIAEPLYSHYELDAAEHAFSVAAGLDSMVLGEPQIHSQVREALKRSETESAAGRELIALFHAASRTGRRVRGETAVGAAPDAFVAAGADLAEEALGSLRGRHAVVVGAGQMSALAVKHLRHRDVATVRVLNRSLERARALAERTGAEHGDLEQLGPALDRADLLVSATGASGVIVHATSLAGRDRPLFVLDLAVPRDVEPSAGALSSVTLVDIEGLRDTLDVRAAETAADIERAHGIVAEEVERFARRRRSERLAPLILALRERGEAVVASELERFRSDLATLTPDERAAVEALARGVVAKLLHEPIVRMKDRPDPAVQDRLAALLTELFGVEPARE
jgi:glutamyl-tRNA reductase